MEMEVEGELGGSLVVGRTAGCWGAGPREKGKAAARWAAQTAVGWAMVAVMVVMVVVVAVVMVVLTVAVGMAAGGEEAEAGAGLRSARLADMLVHVQGTTSLIRTLWFVRIRSLPVTSPLQERDIVLYTRSMYFFPKHPMH